MNLIELKTFLTVIDEKGITSAAKRLNLTQPAISKRLNNLKNSFGIKKLFTRVSGELLISKEAQVIMPYAKNIIALAENAKQEVDNYSKGKKGKITIGSGSGWITGNLPAAIAKTIESYSNIQVDFNVDSPDLQLDKLIDNKIDILFARKPEKIENFDYTSLRHDKYVVIASKKHPLTGKSILIEDLTSYNFVIATTSQQTVDLFFNFFNSRNIKKPKISITTNSLRMGLNSLYKSNFLLFTQANIFESYDDTRLNIIDIKNFNISRETGVITRKGYESSFYKNLMDNLIV